MSDNVAAQGDHLPECPTASLPHEVGLCICDRLRACAQRVLADRDEIVGLTAVRSFRAGLDAAMEAVAAAEAEFIRITGADRDSWACRVYGDALAAIADLKEKK